MVPSEDLQRYWDSDAHLCDQLSLSPLLAFPPSLSHSPAPLLQLPETTSQIIRTQAFDTVSDLGNPT